MPTIVELYLVILNLLPLFIHLQITRVNRHFICGPISDIWIISKVIQPCKEVQIYQAYLETNLIYAYKQANFKATLSTESLLTSEEAVIAAAASEAVALAKAAVKVAKDAALLVKKKPPAEAGYRSHISSKSDDLLIKWVQNLEAEDGVAGGSMGTGAGVEMVENVDNDISRIKEESGDVEPTHKELEHLQEQLSDSVAVRSKRQTERKARRVRAAEKAASNMVSFKSGPTSRKKRGPMQEVDYSDPLRYLRTTTSTTKLLTPTEEVELSEGIQVRVACQA